ncbi:mRNA interferase RelE/StbE [Agrococcus baldri]|uniref:mRNA interferase RelE/StbE n=1 Tax=Agrococcus baldri TaxID=153730 RepID=A0AA94KZP4_9MICO|nr:type II toxin-antitoxin system RelE/ParE family toxin [Agrococcus baldri]SFS11578.1 mRNA interferase RelE/StbE [Agrococcus baldri]
MSYRIQFTTAAARQIKKLPRPGRDRVLRAIDGLAVEPRPQGSKKLTGEVTAWRIRVGDFRVLYDVFDVTLVVTVVRAGHRRDVYEHR